MFNWETRQRKLRISSHQVYFVTFLLDIQVLTSLNLFKIRARRGTKSRDLGQSRGCCLRDDAVIPDAGIGSHGDLGISVAIYGSAHASRDLSSPSITP